MVRLTPLPDSERRCIRGVSQKEYLTRCMLKRGHNGPHVAKWRKDRPYERLSWFEGDERTFDTDKPYEWAWKPKK